VQQVLVKNTAHGAALRTGSNTAPAKWPVHYGRSTVSIAFVFIYCLGSLHMHEHARWLEGLEVTLCLDICFILVCRSHGGRTHYQTTNACLLFPTSLCHLVYMYVRRSCVCPLLMMSTIIRATEDVLFLHMLTQPSLLRFAPTTPFLIASIHLLTWCWIAFGQDTYGKQTRHLSKVCENVMRTSLQRCY
jgi:hypothetical protein